MGPRSPTLRPGWPRWSPAAVLAVTATASLVGCKEAAEALSEKAPATAKLKAENGGALSPADPWSLIPVPPADGPKLAPIAMIAPVYPKPSKREQPIGYLRVGAKVPRSPEPVSREGCPKGWYALRPVGFVCDDKHVTLKLDHPVVRAITVEPNRAEPMPYKYAFLRAIAPNYLRMPRRKEQFEREMSLKRHLRNYKRLHERWDRLDVGANDVPLDAKGYAIGDIPDHAKPMDMSVRYGGDGHDEVPWWLEGFERRIPNLSTFRAPRYAVIAGRVRRHAGVALLGTFVGPKEAGGRRFAISTDARLLPADKLKADSGSPWHGRSLEGIGLPVAFMRKKGARIYDYDGKSLKRGRRMAWREFVPLTGKVMRYRGVRMVETRDGHWVRSQDMKVAAKPSTLPSWAKGGQRWIEIGIVSQTMVLWEGTTPVYATLVSTGRGGLGEPGKTLSTPRGTYRIYQKHVTTTMDSDVADHEFELRDVPWVMYFKNGYALHGAYWHDDFGKVRSHGCVNLAPIDARVAFRFSDPPVPQHWHAGYSGDAFGKGTVVHIHP